MYIFNYICIHIQLTWLNATRPDIEIMKNRYYITQKLIAGRKYKFKLKPLNENKDQIHYIGVYANMVLFIFFIFKFLFCTTIL